VRIKAIDVGILFPARLIDRLNSRLVAAETLRDASHSALLQKSAKPTDDNSPPIHRWGAKAEDFNESVKRTTEDKPNVNEIFSRPLHGLDCIQAAIPSAEALGYFHSSASPTFAAKPVISAKSISPFAEEVKAMHLL